MKGNRKVVIILLIFFGIIIVGAIYVLNEMNDYIQMNKPREITSITQEHRYIVNKCFNLNLSEEIEINSIISKDEGYGVELIGIKDLKSFIYNDLNVKLEDKSLETLANRIEEELLNVNEDYFYENINGEKFSPASFMYSDGYKNPKDENKAEYVIFYKSNDKLCAYLFMDHAFSDGPGLTKLFF